jgi:uncharacterized membrane protein
MTVLAAAVVIHVLSVIWWIGGLAFVTAVILPALRASRAGDAHTIFELIESRFAPGCGCSACISYCSSSRSPSSRAPSRVATAFDRTGESKSQ